MPIPEFRFVKLFRGKIQYNNPVELENRQGIETIKASSFPHRERDLRVIALVKIPPRFYGEISGSIVETNLLFDAAGMQAPNEITWLTFNQELKEVVFPNPGTYTIEMTVNDKPAHSITVQLFQE